MYGYQATNIIIKGNLFKNPNYSTWNFRRIKYCLTCNRDNLRTEYWVQIKDLETVENLANNIVIKDDLLINQNYIIFGLTC